MSVERMDQYGVSPVEFITSYSLIVCITPFSTTKLFAVVLSVVIRSILSERVGRFHWRRISLPCPPPYVKRYFGGGYQEH